MCFPLLWVSASRASVVFALVSRFDTLPRCLCTVTELVYLEWSELSTAVPVMHHSSGHILPTLSICSRPAWCVCVCVHACVCAYVKACNCNPHPATSDQVFSLSHQQYAAEKAEAACVQVSLMVVSKFEKRWTVLLKGVTVWISKYWVKSWVNWIEAHSVGLNALWDFT